MQIREGSGVPTIALCARDRIGSRRRSVRRLLRCSDRVVLGGMGAWLR